MTFSIGGVIRDREEGDLSAATKCNKSMFVDKLELEILGVLTLRSGSWGFLVLRPGLFKGIEVAN